LFVLFVCFIVFYNAFSISYLSEVGGKNAALIVKTARLQLLQQLEQVVRNLTLFACGVDEEKTNDVCHREEKSNDKKKENNKL